LSVLAKRIREIREAKNLTQEEVAFICNMSASAYGQIERKAGTSKYETLCKVANALDVNILFLLDVDNSKSI
jgi:transcriptional regulator with XRE-family HTH domain|tara:strand:- start:2524 stop:2739 length:216 start_codon:yes stop_codon:yes gene_type:complete